MSLPPYPKNAPPMPESVQKLPTFQGWPVPWFVEEPPEGHEYDLRVVSEAKRRRAMDYRLCGICGGEIPDPGWVAFIGGNLSVQNRLFSDPGSHEECARYAAKVCPYLAGTMRQHTDVDPEKYEATGKLIKQVLMVERPDRMAIYCVTKYEQVMVRTPEGKQLLIQVPKKPRKLDWDIMPESSKWAPIGTKLDGTR